jgi:hypothetical protein
MNTNRPIISRNMHSCICNNNSIQFSFINVPG